MPNTRRLSIYIPLFVTAVALLSITYNAHSSEPLQADPEMGHSFESINLRLVARGFEQPLGIVSTGIPGDNRLFIVERAGKIKVLEDGLIQPNLLLDLEGDVALEGEQGLLGLAFDPNFSENGYFYVNYTENTPGKFGDTVIGRYTYNRQTGSAYPGSEFRIIEIAQDGNSHNGGHLVFDSSGSLVIGMGDGGGYGDPLERANSKRSLLGKMIRIDVHDNSLSSENGCGRVRNYTIPSDNPRPRGEDDWCPEILSIGWRNPWRYSLDPDTDRMWVGDVGQDRFEEINYVPRTTTVLRNYGWSCYEGWDVFNIGCFQHADTLLTFPVDAYARENAEGEFLGSSVTGGFVYQGSTFPELQKNYFYADFISGNFWAIDRNDLDTFDSRLVFKSGKFISSFGIDNEGELYVADLRAGEIFQMMGSNAAMIQFLSPGHIEPGQIGTWSIKVTNLGGDMIENITFDSTLPPSITQIEAEDSTNSNLSLHLSEIQPGETKQVDWQGQVPAEPGKIRNPLYSVSFEGLDSEPISPEDWGYVELDNGILQTYVSETIETIFLPALNR